MLTQSQFPQQAYGKCQGVLAMVKDYGCDRVENACRLMKTETSTASLRVLTNILKNNRDMSGSSIEISIKNENVRGADAYACINDGKENVR